MALSLVCMQYTTGSTLSTKGVMQVTWICLFFKFVKSDYSKNLAKNIIPSYWEILSLKSFQYAASQRFGGRLANSV